MTDPTNTEDPFADDASDTPAPDAANEPDPFGAADDSSDGEGGDDDFFDIPEPPIGVLNGWVSDCKRNPKNTSMVIIEVTIDEPDVPKDTKTAVFINMKKVPQRFFAICAALGVPVAKRERQQGPVGGLKALKGKAAKWVCTTYSKDGNLPASSVAWGLPKPGESEGWDAWFAEANLSDAQISAIKKSPACVSADF